MSPLSVLVAIGVIVYVIGQQLAGRPVSGKRLVVLPAVLSVVGILDLTGAHTHADAIDILLLVVSAAVAIAAGVGLGLMTRLERRDGALWAQLPTQGLWLWAGLIASRLVIAGVGHVAGAHLAAGSTAILLVLGLNRAAQALVIVPRAIAAGIPFAPEKDGSVFGAGWFSAAGRGDEGGGSVRPDRVTRSARRDRRARRGR